MNRFLLRGPAALLLALAVPACGGDGDTIVVQAPAAFVPDPGTLVGLTDYDTLLFFDPAAPDTAIHNVPITGVLPGYRIHSIDYRPADGLLYGQDTLGRLYRLDPATGFASLVRTLTFAFADGLAFDPVADDFRGVGTGNEHATDDFSAGPIVPLPDVAYDAGDPNVGANPTLEGLAQTNQVAGAVSTSIYAIDSDLDILVAVHPTTSLLTTIGSLGIDITGSGTGFDISAGGTAYLTAAFSGATSKLYTVNLGTGTASLLGQLPAAYNVRSLAVVP